MTIRLKIFLCLAGVVLLLWGGTAYVATDVFLTRFEELDEQRLSRTLNRVIEGLKEQGRKYESGTRQWLKDNQDRVREETSAPSFLSEFGLNLLAMVGEDGRVERIYWREFAANRLATSDSAALVRLVMGGDGGAASGIVQTTHGPLMAATARRTAEDGGGGVVTGVFLDAKFEQGLRNLMLTDLQFLPPSGEVMGYFRGRTEQTPTVLPPPAAGADSLSGYALLRDVSGQPALVLKLTDGRHSLMQGTGNLRFFLGTTAASAIAMVLLGTFLVEVLVVGRLKRLTNSARRVDINSMDDLPQSFLKGVDEISVLARVTKAMVESLKSSQLLYRAVVEAQTELIVRFKPDGTITLANEAFAEFFGRHPKAVPGKNLREFLTEGILGFDILGDLPDAAARSKSGEHRLVMPDGGERWLLWNQRAMLGEGREVTEIQAAGHDVTLRRDYEEKLKQAKSAAEAADRAKSEFLTVMSHETRTPLTGILGFTAILESTPLDEQQREYLSLIRSGSNSLLMLLNDLLDYSNVASGRIELRPETIEISTIVREVAAIHSPEARQKELDLDLDFEVDTPTYIQADPGRLRQVLHNIVGNAVKFTSKGFVRISVRPGKEPRTLAITVQDTGEGISAENQQKLFKPFAVADSSESRGHGGAGVGLAVSDKVICLMGGRIEVRSELHIGSLFTVVIPIGEPAPPQAGAASTTIIESAKRKDLPDFSGEGLEVMVVDDNLVNQKVISRLLEMMGVKPEVASGGRQCLAQNVRRNFDIIFLDIQMPEMDGYEVVSRIRHHEAENPGGKSAYVVACTAFTLPGDREKCLDAGMDDYIGKPVRTDALAAAIQRYLDSAPARRAAQTGPQAG